MKDWKTWALLIAVIVLVKMCGGCDGSNDKSSSERYEQSSRSSESESAPSWLQGTWICNTQYGSIIVEIDGDHIREDYGDGAVFYGTYKIYDGKLHPNTNSHVSYPLDMSACKIGDGRGGYFRKQ